MFCSQGQSSKPVPFAVFGVLSIACSILNLCLRETVGTSLPDRLRPGQLLRENSSLESVPVDPLVGGDNAKNRMVPLCSIDDENLPKESRTV